MEAKKVTVTPFMNVSRMLRTSLTFDPKDYKKFIEICLEQLEARKEAFIEKQNDIIAKAKDDIENYDKPVTKKPKPKP